MRMPRPIVELEVPSVLLERGRQMKYITVALMAFTLLAGCIGKQEQPVLPGPVDPLPASSGAAADRDAAWSDLQELLLDNQGVLPRQDVKELLINAGGTAYTQRFSLALGDQGSWPAGGALYVYGWKGESLYHAIVVRTEGANVVLDDANCLLEKRDFQASE